ARHAERGRLDALRADLALGLRLTIVIGLPASAGLVLLAKPITSLLFQHGAFDAGDARQTTAMIAAYGLGTWAYCGLLIVNRGFYAIGDRHTPLRIGLIVLSVNLVLNLVLIWPVGGWGLALATSIAAMLQVLLSVRLVQERIGRLEWVELWRTIGKASLATAAMSAVCLLTSSLLAETGRIAQVAGPAAVSIIAYAAAARLLGLGDLWLLLRRDRRLRDREEAD
ncbi:MAG: murein biosynthesis integral membrane protein MurJ, partial [Planctomycetaceae bacterium]